MDTAKTLARAILSNAAAYEWSLQGFGMLRLHLPNDYRLHVWDSRYRSSGVSMIHDHMQWGLISTVIAGVLINRRYAEDPREAGFLFTTLKPGYGCYFKHEPKETGLLELDPLTYLEGDSYSHKPDEIHQTDAQDGTVTLMHKKPTGDESARVFWPVGSEWGSAEPRRAYPEEVEDITSRALRRWFE